MPTIKTNQIAYKTSSLHLEATVHDRLRRIATKADVSLASIVTLALKQYWKGKTIAEVAEEVLESGAVRRRPSRNA